MKPATSERALNFINEVLRNPDTGKPFELFEAQREFFSRAWELDGAGRLAFPEQCFAAPKKSGKTAIGAMHLLTTLILFGGKNAEGYCVANDLEQAQGRVFQAIRQIVEASPRLRNEAEITQTRIFFPRSGACITAIGNDYASAAGSNPTISSFDELWGYTSERSRRLYDEMIPVPTRKISCRLTTTYAGFEGESDLLYELFQRGLGQNLVGQNLHAGDGLLMAWHHEPVAPWQDARWLAEMRRALRPNQYLRMIENHFVTNETSFVDLAAWDRCVDSGLSPIAGDRGLSVFVGVDASTKHDATAIVAVTFDRKAKAVRLIFHRTFQPSRNDPLDFEDTIERTLIELRSRFRVAKVLFDPWQMQSVAQRLRAAGLPIDEFAQSTSNLTASSQNLFELINGGNLILYPDAAMRQAASHAVAVETARGWRITKEKAAHKIDVIVALAMAAYAAVQNSGADKSEKWVKLAHADLRGLGPLDASRSAILYAQSRGFGRFSI